LLLTNSNEACPTTFKKSAVNSIFFINEIGFLKIEVFIFCKTYLKEKVLTIKVEFINPVLFFLQILFSL